VDAVVEVIGALSKVWLGVVV